MKYNRITNKEARDIYFGEDRAKLDKLYYMGPERDGYVKVTRWNVAAVSFTDSSTEVEFYLKSHISFATALWIRDGKPYMVNDPTELILESFIAPTRLQIEVTEIDS